MGFSDYLAVICKTAATVVVTLALLAVVVLLVKNWRLERKLAAFSLAPSKHWFFGHLPKVFHVTDFFVLLL